jgi:hypothetical protein
VWRNVATSLWCASWLAYAGALFLPSVNSTTLGSASATYGWEIPITFTLLVINPLTLARPILWLYILTLLGTNVVVLLLPRLLRKSASVRRSVVVAALTFAVLSALSPAAGAPAMFGVKIQGLLAGYYCWVLSVVTAAAAIVLASGHSADAPTA